MIQLVGQVTEGVGAATQILDGRSESLIVVVVGIVLVGFVLWRDSRRQEIDDKRQDRREAAQREDARRNSDSLKIISESASKSAEGLKLIAEEMKQQNQQQDRDRKAILAVIESVEARNDGNESKVTQSLRDAKNILISD